MKPSDDTTIPFKNDSWQVFDTPFSFQHDGNNGNNEDTRAHILRDNSRVNSTKWRSTTNARDIKRMKGTNQFKKVPNNRTPNDVSSTQNQNEKETSMMKRIKKSLSTKRVNSNSEILENDVSSSHATNRKSNRTTRTNRSLSLKKFKSLRNKGETTSPSHNQKRKSRRVETKKLSSLKNKINKNTRADVEHAVSLSPSKNSSVTKRISQSVSTKNKDTGTGNNSVDEVVVDWSQKL